MEYIQKVLVLSNSFQTDLKLSSTYLFWQTSTKLKCFHIDSILSYHHTKSTLTLLIFHSVLKSYKFILKSDATPLISLLNPILYPIPRSFLIVLNPLSGPGNSSDVLRKTFLPVLHLTPYKYKIFEIGQDLSEAFKESFTDLVFLSGDGTVHRVLTEIFRTMPEQFEKISIGVVPTGSRNSLAVELSGKSIQSAVFNIIRGKVVLGDLIRAELDDRVLIGTTAVLLGLGADIPKEADDLRGLGPIRFPFVIIRKMLHRWKMIPASLSYVTSDGETVKKAINFNGLFFGARLNSGEIQAILVENCSKLQSLHIFWQSTNSGQHVHNPNAQFFKFQSACITTNTSNNISIDGEIYSSTSLKLKILPQALKYLGSLKS